MSVTLDAISAGEPTTSTICVAIAARGMPSYFAVAGSCANVMPSIVLISRIPSAPSDAVPDSTTPIACPRSERASDRKKKSMGLYWTAILRTPAEMQMTVDQFHLCVGRHDVHAIGHDARAFSGFDYRQRRMAGEQRGKRAGMMRRKVLDENERNIRIRRQRLEKLCKRLEASCRCAYADDGEVGGRFGCNWKGLGRRGPLPSGMSRLLSHVTAVCGAPDGADASSPGPGRPWVPVRHMAEPRQR